MTTQDNGPDRAGLNAVDAYGRPVKSMRVSVTQRCSLACDYCHHEGQVPSKVEMSPAEIERIARVAAGLGVRKIKITGGEPLMREDITDIVHRISPLMSEISLTTNGYRLSEIAGELKAAGLTRVNVSLHTLDRDEYKRLCGVDGVSSVIQGIERATQAGLRPVKVNMVVLRGHNEKEIPAMMDFCAKTGAILQLIELEASREGSQKDSFQDRFYSLKDVQLELERKANEVTHNELHRRRQYSIDTANGKVKVELVRPMHNTEFCGNCTRIRLSSDGRMKPCLMDKEGETNVLSALREGATDAELRGLFLRVVGARKPYWR